MRGVGALVSAVVFVAQPAMPTLAAMNTAERAPPQLLGSKVAIKRSRPPVSAEQRLISKARSARRAEARVATPVRFSGRAVEGQLGQCVANFAATAT